MDGQAGRTSPKHGKWFATTRWSVVLAAGQPGSPQAQAALETLCRTYWYPLYAYLRRRGYPPEDAQDLTQEFFARLLEKNLSAQADRAKGKFRSFLLMTLNHFLSDERERAGTCKRGGNIRFLSLDEEAPETRYRLEPPDEQTPEKLFERSWARAILERAIERLREEYCASGKAEVYEVLQAFQPGEPKTLSYLDAAARLGTSESAVKALIHRMREHHRRMVREEIAQTVATQDEIDDELRHLISVVSE
jgi:RNA polymerase sigma factor (sigma-70 family)